MTLFLYSRLLWRTMRVWRACLTTGHLRLCTLWTAPNLLSRWFKLDTARYFIISCVLLQ